MKRRLSALRLIATKRSGAPGATTMPAAEGSASSPITQRIALRMNRSSFRARCEARSFRSSSPNLARRKGWLQYRFGKAAWCEPFLKTGVFARPFGLPIDGDSLGSRLCGAKKRRYGVGKQVDPFAEEDAAAGFGLFEAASSTATGSASAACWRTYKPRWGRARRVIARPVLGVAHAALSTNRPIRLRHQDAGRSSPVRRARC